MWINCNWFIYKGLKNKDKLFSDKIKNKTIQILEKKGFFEYFSCKNGQPMGAKNFILNQKIFFGVGASIASFVFFFIIGYLSKYLSQYAQSEKVWKIINIFIIGFMSLLTIFVILETVN